MTKIRATLGPAAAVVLLTSGVVAATGLPVPATARSTAPAAVSSVPTSVPMPTADGGMAASSESSPDAPSGSPDDAASPADAEPTTEAEELVIAGTGLRMLANLTRSSTFFAQLAPSLIFGQLQAGVPAEVLAPLADAYFQAVSVYGEAASGGADAFLAMADAFQAFSPFINPAASALGAAFLEGASSASRAATDAGEGAGHHNSLPVWGTEYLTGLGDAFGFGAAAG